MKFITWVRAIAAGALMIATLPSLPAAAQNETDHASAPQPTSIGPTTSSSTLEDYQNQILLGLFPDEPIESLTLQVRAYPDYGPDNAECVFFGPGSERQGFYGEKTFSFASLPGGVLDRSQAFLLCGYYTHEPHGPLHSSDFSVQKVLAKKPGGATVPVTICMLGFDSDELAEPEPDGCHEACGDAICDGGEPKASDALATLRGAIGSYLCPDYICDNDRDGSVTASDALRVLKRSVRLPVSMLCLPSSCARK